MDLKRFTTLEPTKDLHQMAAAFEPPPTADGSARTWFAIKPLSEIQAEVLIYDFIGVGGVTADDFIRELGTIKASKITLRVNSEGGSVIDGIAIFNAIRRHRAEITAYVDGLAASAASFIIMAANAIVMSPHALLVIHDATGGAIGPPATMRKMMEDLDRISDNIASFYAERAGGTVAEWRARMKEETLFSAEEAVEAGLADRVDGEDEEDVAARVARLQNSDDHQTADDFPFAALQALQAGTSEVVRKQPVPDFDFLAAIKEAMAA